MKDASEDEQVEDFISEVKVGAKPAESKSGVEEKLRKMMDEEGRGVKAKAITWANEVKDEVMNDVIVESGHRSAGSRESAPTDNIEPLQEPPPEPQAVVSRGRRRGRRKIMKKKTLKDDEGYLGSYKIQVDMSRVSSPLIPHSYERRTSMGVVFWRWTSSSKRSSAGVNRTIIRKRPKNWWKARAGKHNVFLWQKVVGTHNLHFMRKAYSVII